VDPAGVDPMGMDPVRLRERKGSGSSGSRPNGWE